MSEWISVKDWLPKIADNSVIVYFSQTGSIETVHIQDYFDLITAGLDSKNNQLYSKWYITQDVTHWMPLPSPPDA